MPGIYAILGEEIVNLPYAFGVNLYHLGERLDIERSSFSRFCRSLNMGNGVLDRSLVWHRPEVEIEVAFRRYCSLQNKHLAVQEIRITSSADTELEFESFIDVGVTTNGYNHLIRVEGRCQDGLKVCIETDTNQKAGFYTFCDGEGLGQPEVRSAGREPPDPRNVPGG